MRHLAVLRDSPSLLPLRRGAVKQMFLAWRRVVFTSTLTKCLTMVALTSTFTRSLKMCSTWDRTQFRWVLTLLCFIKFLISAIVLRFGTRLLSDWSTDLEFKFTETSSMSVCVSFFDRLDLSRKDFYTIWESELALSYNLVLGYSYECAPDVVVSLLGSTSSSEWGPKSMGYARGLLSWELAS